MNWTDLLFSAGIPEPPGFAEACQVMVERRAAGVVFKSKAAKRSRRDSDNQEPPDGGA
jgi:hypothetical protein